MITPAHHSLKLSFTLNRLPKAKRTIQYNDYLFHYIQPEDKAGYVYYMPIEAPDYEFKPFSLTGGK